MAKEITKDIVNFVADEVTSGRVDERFSEVVCILIQDYLDKHPNDTVDLSSATRIIPGVSFSGTKVAFSLTFLRKANTALTVHLGTISNLRRLVKALDNLQEYFK